MPDRRRCLMRGGARRDAGRSARLRRGGHRRPALSALLRLSAAAGGLRAAAHGLCGAARRGLPADAILVLLRQSPGLLSLCRELPDPVASSHATAERPTVKE